MSILDGFDKIISGIVDSREKIGKALSVGSPQNNNLVQSVLGFEITGNS